MHNIILLSVSSPSTNLNALQVLMNQATHASLVDLFHDVFGGSYGVQLLSSLVLVPWNIMTGVGGSWTMELGVD